MENPNEENIVNESILARKKREVRICEKPTITLYEAAAYTGIGVNKLRRLANKPGTNFVFVVGTKRMFKRKQFEEYLESQHSI
jgi:excisionase family DNA binding protein